MLWFPSPLGELWIWIQTERGTSKGEKSFRPRSGNYESEYVCPTVCMDNKFPSPLGELWIWIEKDDHNHAGGAVSVPARGIMNLNRDESHSRSIQTVSVPARGIMNLNENIATYRDTEELFPSPLGELWIWIVSTSSTPNGLKVSVPARGIMNLNNEEFI